jgi:hypothetical protein
VIPYFLLTCVPLTILSTKLSSMKSFQVMAMILATTMIGAMSSPVQHVQQRRGVEDSEMIEGLLARAPEDPPGGTTKEQQPNALPKKPAARKAGSTLGICVRVALRGSQGTCDKACKCQRHSGPKRCRKIECTGDTCPKCQGCRCKHYKLVKDDEQGRA